MRLAYLVLAAAIAAVPSIAIAAWNGPGLYVTYSDVAGEYDIYSGPYSDQSQCAADALALNARVGSDGSGAECEHLDKSLPTVTDAELGGQTASGASQGSPDFAAAAAGATDCSWLDDHACLDLNSIRPGTSAAQFLAKFTTYDCASTKVGPPGGKCTGLFFQVDCVTGLGYGGERTDSVKDHMTKEFERDSPLFKRLCPDFDPVHAKQQRCLKRPRMTADEAVLACNLLLAGATTNKDKALYYAWRGGAYLEGKKFEAAVGDYNKAIALDPLPDYYDYRATAYTAEKRYDLALADMAKALKLKPDNVGYLGARAAINKTAGRFAGALSDYSRAVAVDPDFWMGRSGRAEVLIILKRYAEAIPDAEKVIATLPTFPEGYYLRSVAKRGLGRISDADADLAKARKLMPDVERVYASAVARGSPTPARRSSKH
jgi:hypothetical protein